MGIIAFLFSAWVAVSILKRINDIKWGRSPEREAADAAYAKSYVGGGLFGKGGWTSEMAERQHKDFYGHN